MGSSYSDGEFFEEETGPIILEYSSTLYIVTIAIAVGFLIVDRKKLFDQRILSNLVYLGVMLVVASFLVIDYTDIVHGAVQQSGSGNFVLGRTYEYTINSNVLEESRTLYTLLCLGLIIVLIVNFAISSARKQSNVRETQLMGENPEMKPLAERYLATRIKSLKDNISDLTPDNLDDKMREQISNDISRFRDLCKLNGIKVSSTDSLVEYCFEISTPFRDSLRQSLKEYLTAALLGENTDLPDAQDAIGSMIDDLLNNYKQLDDESAAKI